MMMILPHLTTSLYHYLPLSLYLLLIIFSIELPYVESDGGSFIFWDNSTTCDLTKPVTLNVTSALRGVCFRSSSKPLNYQLTCAVEGDIHSAWTFNLYDSSNQCSSTPLLTYNQPATSNDNLGSGTNTCVLMRAPGAESFSTGNQGVTAYGSIVVDCSNKQQYRTVIASVTTTPTTTTASTTLIPSTTNGTNTSSASTTPIPFNDGSTSSAATSDKALSTPAIAGIAVGSSVGGGVVIAILVFICCKRCRERRQGDSELYDAVATVKRIDMENEDEMRQRNEIRDRLRSFARESSNQYTNVNGNGNGLHGNSTVNNSLAYSTSEGIRRNDNESPSSMSRYSRRGVTGDSSADNDNSSGDTMLLAPPRHISTRTTSELPPSYGTATGFVAPSPPPPPAFEDDKIGGRRASSSMPVSASERKYSSSPSAVPTATNSSGGSSVLPHPNLQPPPVPVEYLMRIRSSQSQQGSANARNTNVTQPINIDSQGNLPLHELNDLYGTDGSRMIDIRDDDEKTEDEVQTDDQHARSTK